MQWRESEQQGAYFKWGFDKRPKEELYILENDPYNLKNQATNPKYQEVLKSLRKELMEWMEDTGDLRAKDPKTTYWDQVLYTPNYQMKDRDITAEIKEYVQLVRDGGGFKELGCLEE
jgi:hypothetical protein